MELPVVLNGEVDAPLQPSSAPQPYFEIIRPVDINNFLLEVVNSKHFMNFNAVSVVIYNVRLKYPTDNLFLNHLLPNLEALLETVIDEMKKIIEMQALL